MKEKIPLKGRYLANETFTQKHAKPNPKIGQNLINAQHGSTSPHHRKQNCIAADQRARVGVVGPLGGERMADGAFSHTTPPRRPISISASPPHPERYCNVSDEGAPRWAVGGRYHGAGGGTASGGGRRSATKPTAILFNMKLVVCTL
ncbi:hypothetical protein GWI33_005517 [Rhynchophorus ferrugineus]|uniref:Uncharacterized protein n=1 Tax=Rhynchophorus ferrugineus TaxID=354439 RepID=A0A834IJY1_RHYFE|nr:hypothetical protein GWI33_005517 [Rhynchophorus ferrugineus]